MDAKRRAAIIKTLVSGKGLDKYSRFDPNYSAQNRVWFVSAIVDALLNGLAPPDADKLEGVARTIIGDANFAVLLDRDHLAEPSVGLDSKFRKTELKDVVRRVEAIYGVIAQKNELAKDGDDTSKRLVRFRRFVAGRRYRGVVRMIYQVNPNSIGYMRYPDQCKKDMRWRVNIDAQPLWTKTGALDIPLTVVDKIDTNNDGVPDKVVEPDDAAAKIWSRPFLEGDECKGNLLDCANAACCILMDTLFEAANPAMFLKAIQRRAPNHLVIVNPNQNEPPAPVTHFLWEDEDEWRNVFSKELVREADFQIGDHVVVKNHGLYMSLVPQGLWSAEHSLVTNLGNRNPNDGKGLRFGGHGMPEPFTIPSVYDHLLKSLQTQLHRTFKIADLFLRFMRADPADPSGIPNNQVFKLENLEVKDPRTQNKIKFDGFTVFFDVTYDDYEAPPKAGRRPTRPDGEADNPLVIFDIKETNEIAIAPRTLKNNVVDQMGRMNTASQSIMVFIKRVPGASPSDPNYYARAAWQVPFVDPERPHEQRFHPLFGGPGGTFKQLERKQMPTGDGRYFRAGRLESGAFITRPNVDTSNLYLDYLGGISAI